MKKAVSFLFLVIFFIYMTNFNFVSATSTTIPGDFVNYGDIMGLQDLGYALIGGAQFEFDSSKYVIEDYSSLSAAGKLEAERQKIKEFLSDYEATRGITYTYNESALYQGQSYYTTAFTQNANQKIEEYAISSQNVDWAVGISPFKFADWATYNRYWINRYADSFTSNDSIVVNPDPDYIQAINFINNSLISVSNYDYSTSINNHNYSYYNPVGSFYCGQSSNYDFVGSTVGSDVYIDAVFTYIIDINIISNNNVYSYSVSSLPVYLNNWWFNPQGWYVKQGKWVKDANNYISGRGLQNGYGNPTTGTFGSYSYSGTLAQCFDDLTRKWKNVNIYVDGEAWSIVSNPAPANPLIPSFPDVIENDDDLAYDIPFPNTNNYEGSFDLTSVLDAIGKAISGASDNDSTTSSVLTGEDVIDTYDGVNIDTQDKVIDLVSTKVFDGTLDTDTTDRLPDIPVPPQPIINGLGGATVLAKYIDATQCILPEEVVLAFWGGFFILIILGLIKNLHR